MPMTPRVYFLIQWLGKRICVILLKGSSYKSIHDFVRKAYQINKFWKLPMSLSNSHLDVGKFWKSFTKGGASKLSQIDLVPKILVVASTKLVKGELVLLLDKKQWSHFIQKNLHNYLFRDQRHRKSYRMTQNTNVTLHILWSPNHTISCENKNPIQFGYKWVCVCARMHM